MPQANQLLSVSNRVRKSIAAAMTLLLLPAVLPMDSYEARAVETESKTRAAEIESKTRTAETDSVVMQALKEEMARSIKHLKSAGDAQVYFIAYRVFEREIGNVSGEYGALKEKFDMSRTRTLDVELRVGSPKLDNSHKIPKGDGYSGNEQTFGYEAQIPFEDDKMALRNIIWLKTDAAFRMAQKKFAQVKANKDVLVAEDDRSDDYVVEKPQTLVVPKKPMNIDHALWEAQVREASAQYREFPFIRTGDVDLTAQRLRRYLVTSTGTAIEDERISYDARLYADTVANDGMVLWLNDRVEVDDLKRMPDTQTLKAMARRLGESLERLRKAPVAQPYAGPAILQGKAAAVFFHEIFGHRIEGHRQKDESEGRTFTDKVGMQVMPKFISVIDDASSAKLGKNILNGYYRFDDEGVASQKVVLVDKGVLRRFLMSCSPIRGFKNSNGHGRCREGHAPVARQSNLMVVADPKSQVAPQELRAHLIREIKRQKKPYGLIFDDIEGGSTLTRSSDPQIYNLYPLKVTKVYPDGRPDELLRGVDIVGTPLASLELILKAGTDVQTFNGVCGAESGWIPVSASSPSLLVKTIEVARQAKSHNKPPLLPDPLHESRHNGVKR